MRLLTIEEFLSLPVNTKVVFDTECYPNFWLCMFKIVGEDSIFYLEQSPDQVLLRPCLAWAFENLYTIGFNSNGYDLPLIALALTGTTTEKLYAATHDIISNRLMPWLFEKNYGVTLPKYKTQDIMGVAPLIASLKTYGGRLHAKKMQDLPIEPGTYLTLAQSHEIKTYCVNDLELTELVYTELSGQFGMRHRLTKKYGIDLISASDAAIAEKIIGSQCELMLGTKLDKPASFKNESFYFKPHHTLEFESEKFQEFFRKILATKYSIDEEYKLSPKTEDGKALRLSVGQSTYRLGRGGIHSSEKSIGHYASEQVLISDFDVASYYPMIKLNQGLHPRHIPQEVYQAVYRGIVDERLFAKANSYDADGNIVMMHVETADGLKIVVNGTFGKNGSRYSRLFDPEVLIAVTLSGQLYLLMLIEQLEKIKVSVISANTDGVVVKYNINQRDEVLKTIVWFENKCSFAMEETEYKSIFMKDVNNYIASTTKGKVKGKGVFSNPWNDPKSAIFRFHKNPKYIVCVEAVIEFIKSRKPIEDSINECYDMSKFVLVKNVKGGAEKNGEYLGKSIRFYYKKNEPGHISYVSNGNKVQESDGAYPMMELLDVVPQDVDYKKYIKIATEMLFELGIYKKAAQASIWA